MVRALSSRGDPSRPSLANRPSSCTSGEARGDAKGRFMLEKIANRFQTIVLVGLVSLLSAVFILQFGGPQAQGCTAGGST